MSISVALCSTILSNECNDLSDIDGRFINKTAFTNWLPTVPYAERKAPDFIKNKTNIGFFLGGEPIGAVDYYPFLQHVCDSVVKNGQKKLLALEMAEWILSDNLDRRISAAIVLRVLYPELKDLLSGSMVTIDSKRQKAISEKIKEISSQPSIGSVKAPG